jgi:predicted AAA+ superfamily ATPase
MSRYRDLETRLADLSAQVPDVLVTGPRQVEKTSLLRRLAGKERRTAREEARTRSYLTAERIPVTRGIVGLPIGAV